MVGTILITGANGSLALHAARYLMSTNPDYTLLLTVRDTSKNDSNTEALRNVLAQYPKAQASIRQLDLSSLTKVKDFAHSIAEEISAGKLPRLASIVCNAFYWNLARPVEMTVDGFEKTFQIIHIAHVSLILRLLGSFRSENARIVLFSTDAVFPGKNSLEKLPPSIPDNLDTLIHPISGDKEDHFAYGFRRYANAKLAVVTWANALNGHLEKNPDLRHITAVAVHPGSLSDSRALRVNTPSSLQFMSKLIIQPFGPVLRLMDSTMRTASAAGTDIARLSTSDAFPGERGYFIMLNKSEPPTDSQNEKVAREVWLKSAEWAGVDEHATIISLN